LRATPPRALLDDAMQKQLPIARSLNQHDVTNFPATPESRRKNQITIANVWRH
jgi:hypothetical protein